jgi:large subunit ribosomal protein L4
MSKKTYRAALQSALSSRVAEGAVVVLSDLSIEQPKTKLLAKTLAQLGLGKKTLLVLGEGRGDLERAAGNLSNVKVVKPDGLNVYDVLKYNAIVILERELPRIHEVWS